jgi:hypothetical protein
VAGRSHARRRYAIVPLNGTIDDVKVDARAARR